FLLLSGIAPGTPVVRSGFCHLAGAPHYSGITLGGYAPVSYLPWAISTFWTFPLAPDLRLAFLMKPRIYIRRSLKTGKTVAEISGVPAQIRLEITSRMGARQRRA